MLITEVVGIRASVEGGGKSGFFCGEGQDLSRSRFPSVNLRRWKKIGS